MVRPCSLLQANKEFENRVSVFAVEITGWFISEEQTMAR